MCEGLEHFRVALWGPDPQPEKDVHPVVQLAVVALDRLPVFDERIGKCASNEGGIRFNAERLLRSLQRIGLPGGISHYQP